MALLTRPPDGEPGSLGDWQYPSGGLFFDVAVFRVHWEVYARTKKEWCLIAAEPRLNDRIRVPQVRVVGPAGEQMGVMPTDKALSQALAQDLDLVEVAPTADPPVCKIMDYGKFRYEQDVKAKESRKKQQQVNVKEMKFRPKISKHDYDTKKHHIERFLGQGSKVKVTIMFRGREMAHTEIGQKLLLTLSEELTEVAAVELVPKLDGRNMVMVLAPLRKEKEKEKKVTTGMS
ncbi:MAG: translation initiation factor IF-3 [Actinomycetota bacterium]|nr:translation initiation factor IF-3 [Actinomycetota bacterium]